MCYPGALQGQTPLSAAMRGPMGAGAGATPVGMSAAPPPGADRVVPSAANPYGGLGDLNRPVVPMPNAYQAPSAYDPAAMPVFNTRMPGDANIGPGEYDPSLPHTYQDAPVYGSYDIESYTPYDRFPNVGPQVKDDVARPYFYLGPPKSFSRGPPSTTPMPVNQDWKT